MVWPWEAFVGRKKSNHPADVFEGAAVMEVTGRNKKTETVYLITSFDGLHWFAWTTVRDKLEVVTIKTLLPVKG